MDSRNVLKWHIRVFKVCGMWPPDNRSPWYTVWMFVFCFAVNIVFPISLLTCVVFVNSINGMVDHLLISSTVFMAAIKGTF